MINNIIFVVYDGIKNSVFQSQVLAPILEDLDKNESTNIKIVCFEKDIADAQKFSKTLPPHTRLELIFFRRHPFFGKISMHHAVRCFKGFIKNISPDKIVARGPLAGYVVLKATAKNKPCNILVQARGLCAQEFRYSTKNSTGRLKKWWNKLIFKSLDKIERAIYISKRIKIEAVSPALKDYLIEYFGAEPANIFIAVKDIPKSVDKYQAVVWRGQIRDELGIPDNAEVYCYSGSFKPWQCAGQTIEAFAFEYFKNSSLFLLVLTQDIESFKNELIRFRIPETSYRILNVKPQELNKYLCAANYGMLLREPDIINFVSRPTKMLEYQACGLKIIHNNTVAWLIDKKERQF